MYICVKFNENQYKMILEVETKKRWKKLREWGIIKKIESETGLSRPTIIKALDTGEMTITVFEKLSEFFNKHEAKLKSENV